MKELAAELGVKYLTRSDNNNAKSGNLNNALAHSKGEFIAIFDADHVPHKDFLIKTLGYFRDKNVSFVQTPQEFYNLDSIQHINDNDTHVLWNEQSLFFQIIMPGKDYWNAAFFCGSCAVVRRSAIKEIGGFATETITEDLHTSIRLHKKGYGSVYHIEPLAFGLAPQTFEPYYSQRLREISTASAEYAHSAKSPSWLRRPCPVPKGPKGKKAGKSPRTPIAAPTREGQADKASNIR